MASQARIRGNARAPRPAYRSACHRSLFEPEAARCDVCDARVDPEGGSRGYAVDGRGLLMWSRGDTTRWEEPFLCAACGAAIGLSALEVWRREDEDE